MTNQPLIIERTYNAPIEKVWNAITDIDQMKQWYFPLTEFKPEIGFEFQFEKIKDGNRFLHLFKVTEVVPGKKLAYSWRYHGIPGNSIVTWELFSEDAKTKLVLTHTGLETFPIGGALDKCNFMQGWTDMLETSLPNYLKS